MPSDDHVAIPANFLLPLLRDLARYGVAVDQVLDCPGGPLSLAPLMRGDVIALDRRDFVHAFGMCTQLLEQAICQSGAKSKNRGKALEACLNFVLAAHTLREACERVAEFNMVLEERGYSLCLKVVGNTARFVIDFNPSISQPPLSLISASTMFFHNLFSWLTAAPIDLLKVNLSGSRPPDGNPCIDLLGAPIAYGNLENCLIFKASNLERRVVRSQEDLIDLDYIAYDPLFCIRSSAPLSNRIRALLQDIVQRDEVLPDSLWVAHQLGVSPSTLSRRLRDENTSFLKLKVECQQDTARLLLRQGALGMQQIAMRLGFADARSFRRAFLGWTGALPSTFRAQSRLSGDAAQAAK